MAPKPEEEEGPRDRLTEVIESLVGDSKFQEFLELMEFHYVYMACHTRDDPHHTAFLEGQRELAAMICGVNRRVHEWQKKTLG